MQLACLVNMIPKLHFQNYNKKIGGSFNGRTTGFGLVNPGSNPGPPAKIMKIFSGRSNPVLSQGIADYLGFSLGKIRIEDFSDGEIRVEFEENIRNSKAGVLSPLVVTVKSVNIS